MKSTQLASPSNQMRMRRIPVTRKPTDEKPPKPSSRTWERLWIQMIPARTVRPITDSGARIQYGEKPALVMILVTATRVRTSAPILTISTPMAKATPPVLPSCTPIAPPPPRTTPPG